MFLENQPQVNGTSRFIDIYLETHKLLCLQHRKLKTLLKISLYTRQRYIFIFFSNGKCYILCVCVFNANMNTYLLLNPSKAHTIISYNTCVLTSIGRKKNDLRRCVLHSFIQFDLWHKTLLLYIWFGGGRGGVYHKNKRYMYI